MKHLISFIILVLFCNQIIGQFPEKEFKAQLDASLIKGFQGGEENIFRAKNNISKKWGLYLWTQYDTETIELLPPEYDKIELENHLIFECYFKYLVVKNNKVGVFCDSTFVLEPIYDDLIKFEGITNDFILQKEKKMGLYYPGHNGEILEVLPSEYDHIEILDTLEDNVIYQVLKGGKTGLYLGQRYWGYSGNIKDNVLLPIKYDKINWKKKTSIMGNYIVPVDKNKFSVVDMHIPSVHIEMTDYFRLNDYGIAIKVGEDKYKIVFIFYEKFKLSEEVYEQVIPLDYGIAVCSDNKWGLLGYDIFGTVIPCQYETIQQLYNAYHD